MLPDPEFLYLGKKHKGALTMLEYGLVNQAGFVVITGNIGSGKTTLIRYALDNMDKDVTVGLITNTHASFGQLMQWVLMAYGISSKDEDRVGMHRVFTDFIINEYSHNKRTVLIIDEAQNLNAETLEELRMLSNINVDKNQLLQMVLVGQPELLELLKQPGLEQFTQRIAVHYHLKPLNAEETRTYIYHRLRIAGAKILGIFSNSACVEIYKASKGIPRVINNLCDIILVYGYAEERRLVDAKLVHEVLSEREQCGLFLPRGQPEINTAADSVWSKLDDSVSVDSSQQEPDTVKENKTLWFSRDRIK